MYLNSTLELVLSVDAEKFYELLDRVYDRSEHSGSNKLVDQALESKGILVTYHDKQYKKKVQLTVNLNVLLDGDEPGQGKADKLIRKLEKRVNSYFGSMYVLDDFSLSKMHLVTDINVGDREKANAYIRVLQRIGKVKGFVPWRDDWLDDKISFSLVGKSNGIEFAIHDLESLLLERSQQVDSEEGEELKAIAKKATGLLRTEVRLVKSAAIRTYANEVLASDQITTLCDQGQKIFLDTLQRIVPFGHFYKKSKAVEIICKEITDMKTRRRMLRLVALAPEKKSLLLAQKTLNCRRIDDVMKAFGYIEVSPITLSKRHDVKYLKNLYAFLDAAQ